MTRRGRPVVFGEVVFDLFPDGSEVLGGAPFNVAWHLKSLGERPLMITRIGDDQRGRAVLDRMQSAGLDVAGVQLDEEHPTGTVRVLLDSAGPRFQIAEESAWDWVEPEPAREVLAAAEEISIWVVGTLALRREGNRRAWRELLQERPALLLADLNLRPPWWSWDIVEELVERADWVKLNQEEAELLGWLDTFDSFEPLVERVRRHHLEGIALTRGCAGSVLVSKEDIWEIPAIEVAKFADSVGAGDAYTAALAYGLVRGLPLPYIGRAASLLAALVCCTRGALLTKADGYTTVRSLLNPTK